MHVVAVDANGGTDSPVFGNPGRFRCGPPAPPISPTQGVLRPLPAPDSRNAWRLSMIEDAVVWTEAEIEQYPVGLPWPPTPDWLARDDGSVWLPDHGVLRSLPNPAAWRVEDGWTRPGDDTHASLPRGSKLPAEPYLVQGPGGEVFMVDRPLLDLE